MVWEEWRRRVRVRRERSYSFWFLDGSKRGGFGIFVRVEKYLCWSRW